MPAAKFVVELERETDGRWIAEVVALPGVLAYGATREEALAKAEVLALRVLADRLEHGEAIPQVTGLFAPGRVADHRTAYRLVAHAAWPICAAATCRILGRELPVHRQRGQRPVPRLLYRSRRKHPRYGPGRPLPAVHLTRRRDRERRSSTAPHP